MVEQMKREGAADPEQTRTPYRAANVITADPHNRGVFANSSPGERCGKK
jgi:hypothetical protein